MSSALSVTELNFRYPGYSNAVINISKMDVSIGDTVFLHGPSGSGKTTLLSLIGGLFSAQSGEISVMGKSLSGFSASQKDRFRAENIGFIFQVFNLVPYLSVIENVLLPCRFGRGVSQGFSSSVDEAHHLIKTLGILGKLNTAVTELSIGQQQRVAAARALIGSPGLIIADEPTSALDADARGSFLSALFDQAKRESSTVIFVSHDRGLASMFSRQIALSEINRASGSIGRDD